MNFINYLSVKLLIKIKFVNLINIAAEKMIIPELIQSNCNSSNIFKVVSEFIENPDKIKNQINETQVVLDSFKTKSQPTDLAANRLKKITSL
jgi:Lipid A disaccharide synthetase